ncbi:MAG: phosphatase PAP2 family protein [Spirochaetales bacterium]|nr:phosphatase PAP2 family protein [Spirochaetales bacterium]
MQDLLAWGVEVSRAFQTVSNPVLDGIVRAVTELGSEWFYLIALPVIYWCVDERRGIRLGAAVFLSAWLNGRLKVLFAQPRPYELDPTVGMLRETSYGLPSGHSQGTATFWGMLAPAFRKPWGLVLALSVPFAVGLSRVYLGVHFPTDVLAGWALGAAIVLPWLAWGAPVEKWIGELELRWKILLAAALTLGMNALAPEETNLGGAFFGMAAGAAWQAERLGFDAASGRLGAKLLRLLLGAAGLAAIYVGGKLILPGEGSSSYALWRFLRYALVGAWVSYGAPELFVRARLAARRSEEAAPAEN